MKKIVFATGNAGKMKEIREILADLPVEIYSMKEAGISVEIDENGKTFEENAKIKAQTVAGCTDGDTIVLADDSGLEVDLLHGRPGVYSARFAGAGASDKENIDKLLAELKGAPDYLKSARFWCVLVYMRHADDPTPIICQASWEGMIIDEPRGQHGFGYDPVFFVPDHDCTSAQMPAELKNQLSHRGQALAKLKAALAAVN